jgi:hypothetical protein
MKEVWRVAAVALYGRERVQAIERNQIWVSAEHGCPSLNNRMNWRMIDSSI